MHARGRVQPTLAHAPHELPAVVLSPNGGPLRLDRSSSARIHARSTRRTPKHRLQATPSTWTTPTASREGTTTSSPAQRHEAQSRTPGFELVRKTFVSLPKVGTAAVAVSSRPVGQCSTAPYPPGSTCAGSSLPRRRQHASHLPDDVKERTSDASRRTRTPSRPQIHERCSP
jgi:hypothetical protein